MAEPGRVRPRTRRAAKSSLAEEIRQTRPFATVEQEAYLSILRTASELSHEANQFMKQYGVTHAQYNVLRILRGAGDDGLCRHQIAERMVAAMPDVSRLLDRMETSGWIQRERSSRDRREVSTFITAAGEQLLAVMEKPVAAMAQAYFKGLPAKQLQQLVDTLAAVRGNIQ